MTHTGHNWTLHVGDCRDVLRTLPDASVDAVVTDPPYGTNDGKGRRTAKGGKIRDFAHAWDAELPTAWLADAARVTTPGGSVLVFTDAKMITWLWDAGESAGLHPLNTFYWAKPDPAPTPRQNFVSAIEAGVFFRVSGGKPVWNGGGYCRNFYNAPTAHKETDGQTRYHPTEKPVSLMRWLCRLVTPPNGLILDPFAGSGTTGVAALRERFSFVGIEREPEYATIAAARLTDAARQPDLFAAGVVNG